MSDEAADLSAKHREEDWAREAHYKEIDEELKVIADIKRYTVAALLAVAVGIFRTEDEVSFFVGLFVCFILLILFAVLVVVRYQKIENIAMNSYDIAYTILSSMIGLTAIITAFFVRKEMKESKH